jgi:MFS family permease
VLVAHACGNAKLIALQGLFVGIIYDRYGTRWLLLVGSFMHVFGIMMSSVSTKYYEILLAQGFCSGIGCAMLFQPCMPTLRSRVGPLTLLAITAAAGWFNRKRGTAMGIAFTGTSLGGVIFPIMVSRLISKVGFGWAMRICAFLILSLLVIANLTVRPWRRYSRQNKVTAVELSRPLREVDFLLILAGFFCFCCGYFVPLNYLPTQALLAGMGSGMQQYLVSILNAASLFGRLVAGFVGDKIGRLNVFVIACYLSGVWILGLWLPDSHNAALIVFAVLFGFFSGAFISLATPVIAHVSPMAELGFRVGMVLFACGTAGLITQPINGAIVDSQGGWTGAKVFSGVFSLVGTSFVLALRVRRAGMKVFVHI